MKIFENKSKNINILNKITLEKNEKINNHFIIIISNK